MPTPPSAHCSPSPASRRRRTRSRSSSSATPPCGRSSTPCTPCRVRPTSTASSSSAPPSRGGPLPDTPLTITDAAARLRDGTTTSVELTSSMLAVADQLDPLLGTFISRYDEQAMAAAATADAELAGGLDRGPLHGIPLGVKDIIASKEGPTTAQSVVYDPDWWAGRDAPVVERLRE